MLMINPIFYLQVKNKPCVHWGYAFILEHSIIANRKEQERQRRGDTVRDRKGGGRDRQRE
jgi:hypothetical protein